MAQSLTNMINLIASVITILGGVSTTIIATTRWRAKQKLATAPPTSRAPNSRGPGGPVAATVKLPAVRLQAQRVARGVSHKPILTFSLIGLTAVTAYSVELLANVIATGSTEVAAGSALVYLNGFLLAINLVCLIAVCLRMMVTAFRVEQWLWLAVGAVILAISLITIGVFSVVAFAPGVYYGLSGPGGGDARAY